MKFRYAKSSSLAVFALLALQSPWAFAQQAWNTPIQSPAAPGPLQPIPQSPVSPWQMQQGHAPQAMMPQAASVPPRQVLGSSGSFNRTMQPMTQGMLPQSNPYVAQPQYVASQMAAMPAMGTPPAVDRANHQILDLMREASLLEKQGQITQSVSKYRQALELSPNHWQVQLSFARVMHRMGDLRGAVSLYHRILAQYPNDAVSLNDLGLLLARQGDIAGSMEHLKRAVALQPRSQRYRNNLATVLIEANELNAALSQLQEVHGEAVGEFNMGYLLAQRGQSQSAGEHLRVALHLDPSLAPARDLLARIDSQVEQIATRTANGAGASSAIILRQSAEIDSQVKPAVDPAVYDAAQGAPQGAGEDGESRVAPLPGEFDIPGIK